MSTHNIGFYDDEDGLVFYVPFNIIYVISRWWKEDNERLCAMKCSTVMSWILPPAGFELWTLWSEGLITHSHSLDASIGFYGKLVEIIPELSPDTPH